MKHYLLVACSMFALASNGVALSQESLPAPKSTGYQKKELVDAKGRKITVVNFDETAIEGKAKSPDGFVLQSRDQTKFRSIIELRRDFRLQMNAGVSTGALVTPASP